jgi:hypothetical protein
MAHTTRVRVLMNASDPLILYTDASTRRIGGVLMQVQHNTEQELFVFVFCVKSLSPYLLGKIITQLCPN